MRFVGNFFFGKHEIAKLMDFDENYRYKKKINVYKFLYIALYDFFSYQAHQDDDPSAMYLDIGHNQESKTKRKILNPRYYNLGVPNIYQKYENSDQKHHCRKTTKPIKDLYPKKNFYHDFEVHTNMEGEDYRGIYSHNTSTKKHYNDMVWLKDEDIQKWTKSPAKPKPQPPPSTLSNPSHQNSLNPSQQDSQVLIFDLGPDPSTTPKKPKNPDPQSINFNADFPITPRDGPESPIPDYLIALTNKVSESLKELIDQIITDEHQMQDGPECLDPEID
jgi:hypothetical protein